MNATLKAHKIQKLEAARQTAILRQQWLVVEQLNSQIRALEGK